MLAAFCAAVTGTQLASLLLRQNLELTVVPVNRKARCNPHAITVWLDENRVEDNVGRPPKCAWYSLKSLPKVANINDPPQPRPRGNVAEAHGHEAHDAAVKALIVTLPVMYAMVPQPPQPPFSLPHVAAMAGEGCDEFSRGLCARHVSSQRVHVCTRRFPHHRPCAYPHRQRASRPYENRCRSQRQPV